MQQRGGDAHGASGGIRQRRDHWIVPWESSCRSWRWFREAAYPWLVATQMVPIPAVAPILVLWFGFTIVPKAATVALMCFFPVAVNTVDGLSSVNPELIRLLRTFGAGPWQVMSMVALPSALPRIFSGVRVAMALSVVGAVVGEWVGSTHGLGYLMLHFENRGETAGLFATVTVLTVMGIILVLPGGMGGKLRPFHGGGTQRRLCERDHYAGPRRPCAHDGAAGRHSPTAPWPFRANGSPDVGTFADLQPQISGRAGRGR